VLLVDQPDAAELRMLGALLLQSVRDAWVRGEDRVRFRGYCIKSRRIDGVDGGHPQLGLTLRVTGVAGVQDRLFIAVAPYPIPGAGCDIHLQCVRRVAPQRVESPVGCVSPIDARYASPETGHISWKPVGRKASEIVSVRQPSRGVPSPHWGWSPHFYPCVPCSF
jgi:hypothetical protein